MAPACAYASPYHEGRLKLPGHAFEDTKLPLGKRHQIVSAKLLSDQAVRFRRAASLDAPPNLNRATFYAGKAHGYTGLSGL